MKLASEEAPSDRSRRWLLFISAGILIVLAAVRSENVGVDVLSYQKPCLTLAQRYNSISAYLTSPLANLEPLYMVVTYIASKLGGLFWVFLINETILFVFIYKTVWYYRDEIPPELSLACYIFIFYCIGYSGIRQNIAIAIIMFALTYLDQQRYLRVVILTIMAVGFHNSAIIIGPAIYILLLLSRSTLSRFWAFMILLTIYYVSVNFVKIVDTLGVYFPSLLNKYIKGYLHLNLGQDFNASSTLLMIVGLIILLICHFLKYNESKLNNLFLAYMLILSIAGNIIGLYSPQLQRVFWNCQTYIIFVLPKMFFIIMDTKGNTIILKSLLYISLIIYFIFFYIVNTTHGVYPFELFNGARFY